MTSGCGAAKLQSELLGERGIDVSARTVLSWYIDEVFLFRGSVKRYLYRAVDEHDQVVVVLLRERRVSR